MCRMSLQEFRSLKFRDFENGAVRDEIDATIEDREKLLALCCELIDTHDNNEWGDSTGSYPEPCRPLDADAEVGELGVVIDKIRALVVPPSCVAANPTG